MSGVKDRVISLCEDRNVKIGTLEREAKLSNGTINKWTEDSIPNGYTLNAIADYFGVSVDYLLGRECEDEDVMELREQLRRQPGMRMLFKAAKGVTAEELQSVASMIASFKKE